MKCRSYIWILVALTSTVACRKTQGVIRAEQITIPKDPSGSTFYLLNEGNLGLNRASLDYVDEVSGIYSRNIYDEVNPETKKGLGDVGNDLQQYGSHLYAVVNHSDKVEVLSAASGRKLGQIDIPNCRYITFSNGKAYISSYNAVIGDANAPEGFVAEVDTGTLKILREVAVGRQPEEMAIVGEKLYVANSGGYSPPDYERTVSVIDLVSFAETKRIDVGINLHRLKKDDYGDIYVTSRGDYYGQHSNLYVIDTREDIVKDSFNLAATNLCLLGDTGYVISVEWSNQTKKNEIKYSRINLKTEEIIPGSFISTEAQQNIKLPFGIAANEKNGNIYLTDATNYVTPGTLYCFDNLGNQKWKVQTGDIPAHFVFIK